jgi:hypothetical protein
MRKAETGHRGTRPVIELLGSLGQDYEVRDRPKETRENAAQKQNIDRKAEGVAEVVEHLPR